MPAPIPVDRNLEPFASLKYQWHQVAIFTADINRSVFQYRRLGFQNWIEDRAELKGFLWGAPVVTQAHMMFGYGVMPMELEFLSYRGPNRHLSEGRTGAPPFISHMSAYVDDVKQTCMDLLHDSGKTPYHRFITQNHTNPNVVGKKRFIEAIYDTREDLGYDLKFIQKVPWDYDDAEWLDGFLDG